MSKYDDLFAATAPDDSVFTAKRALDPLAEPEDIYARDAQERELATLLNGVHDDYLPPTVSLYGPPGTGKTLTTRRVCREFTTQHDAIAGHVTPRGVERAFASVLSAVLHRKRQPVTAHRHRYWYGYDMNMYGRDGETQSR